MIAPIPILLLTGALGSGKSTLLKAMTADPAMADTALIINEFGAVGLDHLLVSSAVENTLLLENGCVCCALRGDLVDTIAALLDRSDAGAMAPFRRIVVETTGLADPAPIVAELSAARNLAGRATLARVLTTVDAALGLTALGDAGLNQIAQADHLALTKVDLAAPIEVDRLRERLAGLNPAAAVEIVAAGRLADPSVLFQPALPAHRPPVAGGHGHGHGGVESWSVRLDRPLPWALVGGWIELLCSLRPAQILRIKGVLWVDDCDLPVLAQVVGPLVSPAEVMPAWPAGPRESRMVVIARGLSAAAIAKSFSEDVLAPAEQAAAPALRTAGG